MIQGYLQESPILEQKSWLREVLILSWFKLDEVLIIKKYSAVANLLKKDSEFSHSKQQKINFVKN